MLLGLESSRRQERGDVVIVRVQPVPLCGEVASGHGRHVLLELVPERDATPGPE